MKWIIDSTLLIGKTENIKDTDLYACFDFDGTLVNSKSGGKFIKNKDDWKFCFDNVKDIIRKYDSKNYHIVIFTNQAGIKMVGIENWKDIITDVITKIGIDIDVFVAMKYDLYRKPFPTMWERFIGNKTFNKKSFYCGDACGRENDFSDSDFKFALNCYLNFSTPEEIFKASTEIPHFIQPRLLNVLDFTKYYKTNANKYFEMNEKEILVLVGNYACGKTHFVNKYLPSKKYTRIDSTLSEIIEQKLLEESINKNMSIVIDKINLTIKSRKKYIQFAKENNYKCRCVNFVCPISVSLHNTRYRNYITNGKEDLISDTFIIQYRDNFEFPSESEGFDKIIKYYFEIDNTICLSKYSMFLF